MLGLKFIIFNSIGNWLIFHLFIPSKYLLESFVYLDWKIEEIGEYCIRLSPVWVFSCFTWAFIYKKNHWSIASYSEEAKGVSNMVDKFMDSKLLLKLPKPCSNPPKRTYKHISLINVLFYLHQWSGSTISCFKKIYIGICTLMMVT